MKYLRLRKDYGDPLPGIAHLKGFGDYASQNLVLEYWTGTEWDAVPLVESDDWDSPETKKIRP